MYKGSSGNTTLNPPMPGIIPFQNLKGPLADITEHSHWLCAQTVVSTANITKFNTATVTAYCEAGTKYLWGFSFLLTFVVLVIQLIVALIMYGLWVCFCREAGSRAEVSEFKDAAMMITQAQQQHGDGIASWDVPTLKRRVLKGKHGVTVAR